MDEERVGNVALDAVGRPAELAGQVYSPGDQGDALAAAPAARLDDPHRPGLTGLTGLPLLHGLHQSPPLGWQRVALGQKVEHICNTETADCYPVLGQAVVSR